MLDEGLLEGLKGWRQVPDESAKENKERKVVVSSKVNLRSCEAAADFRLWSWGEHRWKLGCQRIIQGILYKVNRSSGASKTLKCRFRVNLGLLVSFKIIVRPCARLGPEAGEKIINLVFWILIYCFFLQERQNGVLYGFWGQFSWMER